MADGDVKDYAGEKKKPSLALVISVGPKMPKKPEDTSKPDEPMKKAWHTLVEHVGTYELSKNMPYHNVRNFNPAQAGMDGLDEEGNYPTYDSDPRKHMMPKPYTPQTMQEAMGETERENPIYQQRMPSPMNPLHYPIKPSTPAMPEGMPPPQEVMTDMQRNMMADGTRHSPGQQSMIDRATEMLRQQRRMNGE